MVFVADDGAGPSANVKPSLREALAQILAVCVKNVLLLSFGMTMGFPTILIPGLSGADPNEPFVLSPESISWIGSINLICIPIGCMVSGAVTQAIGRKRAMQAVNIPFIVAWLILRFSTSVWHIFLGLCITGLAGGFLEAPVITYVAEITQPYLRGMLSSTSSLAVIGGILMQFFLGSFLTWRTLSLVSCAFPLLAFALLFFVPESPHWLISKDRLAEAKKSIAWLRGWTTVEDVEGEFKELYAYVNKGIENPAFEDNAGKVDGVRKRVSSGMSCTDKLRLFTSKNFIWPYFIVSLSFFLGHFCGMTTLQTYAVQIFASLRAPIDKYFATTILGVAELLGCVTCVFMVRVLGKRKLNFASLVGCGICFAVVATYAYSIDVNYIVTSNNATNATTGVLGADGEDYSWLPLTLLILSAFLSHCGIRVLPWILTGELYSNETRATASGLSGATGYVFSFLANKTFLSAISAITLPGMFWINAGVSFVGCLLLFLCLPETEGKSLHDITEHFRGGKELGKDVRKNGSDSSCKGGKVNSSFEFSAVEKSSGHDIESHL